MSEESKRGQAAQVLLGLSVALTLSFVIAFALLDPVPRFPSLLFKDVRAELGPSGLTLSERLRLKGVMIELNSHILSQNVRGETTPARRFALRIVEDPTLVPKSERKDFELILDRRDLADDRLVTRLLLWTRLQEQALQTSNRDQMMDAFPKSVFVDRPLVWASCEPPSLQKISALRRQVRKVLFLQICAPPERGLAQSLRENRVYSFLLSNPSYKFAILDVAAWRTFEKWHGDLWQSSQHFKEKAGVVEFTTDKRTKVTEVAAAIEAIRAFRGLEIL